MRADIHDGSEHHTLQSEAGYIDARPHPPDRRNLLPRTAGLYIGVTTGLMHCSKIACYSITSSARASSVAGTSRPSALAILRLMISSNLVGCCTGSSEGLA